MTDLLLCAAILALPVVATLAFIVRAAPRLRMNAALDVRSAQRAQDLLERLLPEEQRQALASRGYLAIDSRCYPRREYRIWHGGGPVEVYDDGRYAMSLCVEPLEPLPPADVVLMHKLMIEGQEEEYLRVANRLGRTTWLGRTGRRRGATY